MKKWLLVFIFLPIVLFAQQNNTGIPIPMKNGKVFYEKVYPLTAGKAILYQRALQWFTATFAGVEQQIKTNDKQEGSLVAAAAFKIVTTETGNYYWLKPTIEIAVSDTNYLVKLHDYYEKPVEKGISNEYSKIEYRWWDYRQGKPWSGEDKKLFEGLDEHSVWLMDSLEKAMKK